MKGSIELRNISFHYKETDEGVLSGFDLSVRPGECVLLCGESGCGKTTVTRLINGLIPHFYEGVLEGDVFVSDISVKDTQIEDLAGVVGSVFQNPRSQFFCVDTTSEIAFGCENMHLPEDEIRKRIDDVTREIRCTDLLDRNIFHLSGGEKQKIACAGVAAMLPDIIVLDEPTSNLDLDAIEDLRGILLRWKKQGKTIVIAEHRLGWLRDICDRVLLLGKGEVREDMTGEAFFDLSEKALETRGLRSFTPAVNYLEKEIGFYPISSPWQHDEAPSGSNDDQNGRYSTEVIVLQDFSYSYDKHDAIRIDHLEIPAGSVVAVVGRNGAGKSTFSRCLCGLMPRFRGEVLFERKRKKGRNLRKISYMVMQDVNHQLFAESVLDEVMLGMETEEETKAEEMLRRLNIAEYKDRHPMSLSGGQKQRVAIASAMVMDKPILVLDEPTSGLDHKSMVKTAELMQEIQGEKTIFVITHDMELIEKCCTHVLHIENGRVR